MSPDTPVGGGSWTPPYVQPLLRALDRMERRRSVSPEAQTGRALNLLIESLGPAPYAAEATFSHGVLGLAADHTIMMEGFALMLPIRDGIAVAVRESDSQESRLVFDGTEQVWEFDATETPDRNGVEPNSDVPWWSRLTMETVRRAGTSGRQVDVAVVSTIVSGCQQPYSAALCSAALGTTQAVFPPHGSALDIKASMPDLIAEVTGQPQTPAFTVATDVASIGKLILVDTRTGRRLPFPTPSADPAGWGIVDTADRVDVADKLLRAKDDVTSIVERLRKKGFRGLDSLRDLEHKDLELAERAVARNQRRLLRYLVRENQRVHRLVTAARLGDWQLFGALLLMGHASLRDEMGATSKQADLIVELAEERSATGMYGGRAVGFAGVVVVLGQPFIVPQFLDFARGELDERFGVTPNTVLL